MDEFHPVTLIASLALLMLVSGLGYWFYLRQNRGGQLGGAISGAKAVWLIYAVYVWFFLTPCLAFDANQGDAVRLVLGAFSLNMWLRGIAELVMLYVLKNWRPPYGIAHDVWSLSLLLFGAAGWWRDIVTESGTLGYWLGAYLIALILSLVCETYYAVVFHRLVDGKTMGDDGTWFAPGQHPDYLRINRITFYCNIVLLGFLMVFLTRIALGYVWGKL